MQQKFTAICFSQFFSHVQYGHIYVLEHLKLHTSSEMRYHLDALLLVQFYLRSKFCSHILETAGLRHPAWHIRDFSFFDVCSSKKILLVALQLLMLFVRILTYFEPKLFLLITFCNGTFLSVRMLIIFSMNISI